MAFDPVVAAEALDGLRAEQKTLPAKLFYDEEGCRLFYRITELPEYYLTRTERTLLPMAADWIAGVGEGDMTLVEYGASDEEKAGYLLRTGGFAAYVPIDVAAPALRVMAERVRRSFAPIVVSPVVGDFTTDLVLPPMATTGRLGFFPGSTIGNLEPAAAVAFLARARRALGEGARFLLGADVRKSPEVLIPAYDDAQGVTAAFNRNLLVRLNREAASNFDPSAFAHRAIWNDAESRIEMHLVSARAQTVRVAGHDIYFYDNETIHTENSYKHPRERLAEIARAAGWRVERSWSDPEDRCALWLFVAEPSARAAMNPGGSA